MKIDEDVEKAIEEDVPVFFRTMARQGLIDFARKKGLDHIDLATYQEAKAQYLGGHKED